jgi:dTDP-4-dehydro-6-deoxy-alpha-D-glucopyranose 2,3-dehydratase
MKEDMQRSLSTIKITHKKAMKNKSVKYSIELKKYKHFMKGVVASKIYNHAIESSFEGFNDWSLFYSLDEIKQWFLIKKENPSIIIKEIDINQMKEWNVDIESGNIYHDSNDFFLIRGLRVEIETRESAGGWDQPIVEQIGYDGGLLGIIRKRFSGVPHYLCEAKIEPGNYGLVQLSPTLQATFSNLNKKHKGRGPYFAEYFDGTKTVPNSKILFDSWLAEDGGRFYKKRNRGMLVELPESYNLSLPNDNFCWLSLYQIKQMLKEDSWINPHIRGILAHT